MKKKLIHKWLKWWAKAGRLDAHKLKDIEIEREREKTHKQKQIHEIQCSSNRFIEVTNSQ